MCGIWGLFGPLSFKDVRAIYGAFHKVKARGPDCSEFFQVDNEILEMFIGFHRLSIMDRSTRGNQPFVIEEDTRTIYAQANGEVYDFCKIIDEYSLDVKSNSDCEVIPLLIQKFGFEKMLDIISGTGSEFALMAVIVHHTGKQEVSKVEVYAARDMAGIRPVFFGFDNVGMGLSSELKGLIDSGSSDDDPVALFDNVKQLEAETYLHAVFEKDSFVLHLRPCLPIAPTRPEISDESLALTMIRDTFIEAVVCRMEADRPIASLLSGGLDSSLVTSIMAKHSSTPVTTYSVGMKGGTDEGFAKIASKYIGTNHTHFSHTAEEFIKLLPEVSRVIESFDITTMRASTGQLMVCRDVAKHSDAKVLFIGDGSDELCSGYIYFSGAPDAEASHQENIRLVKNLRYYDVKRADSAIAGCGIEARTPFLDSRFIQLYLSISKKLRQFSGDRIEKHLLRKAFDGQGYLPHDILWRRKEAFSDGISSVEDSWHTIVQKFTTDYYEKGIAPPVSGTRIEECGPLPTKTDSGFVYTLEGGPSLPEINTAEAYYFRKLFALHHGNKQVDTIPGYWYPQWTTVKEPSARALKHYHTSS